MNIFDILYTIIIGPLKLLFEVVFTLAYYVTNNAGISIIVLSLVVNILVLPLYKRADQIQKEQNDIEKKLKPGVDHIKKTFKGDERYMILQTYYRQNNYKPTDVLKSSVSLLLQIPFFMAAYDFLSNLKLLYGVSFGPITNLALPDQLLNIGGISINVLPILMTLINIVSSIIYTKDQPMKAKIQLYSMAFIFLVFLYNRPSGLAFYWTLNNLFSLIKNILTNNKTKKLLCILLSVISVIGLVYIIINPLPSNTKEVFICAVLILMNIPLLLCYEIKLNIKQINVFDNRTDNKLFILLCVLLSIMLGITIPTLVVNSSPQEFIDSISITNPLIYVFNSFFLAFGTFCIWSVVYYFLSSKRTRQIITLLFSCFFVFGLINYSFFSNDIGYMSNLLQYNDVPVFSLPKLLINIFVLIITIVLVYALLSKNRNIKTIRIMVSVVIIVLMIVSVFNIASINSSFNEVKNTIGNQKEKDDFSIELNQNSRNVIVILLDRAISSFFPYILNEKPLLLNQFKGFTYYPNTISFGDNTTIASSSVYGGYEYTPFEMNKRNKESMMSKHNEALKMLPTLFNNNGFETTMCNVPLANYNWFNDMSIYDDTNIKGYATDNQFRSESSLLTSSSLNVLNRNLFCFSLTKTVPLVLHNTFYNSGLYNSIDNYNEMNVQQVVFDISSAKGINKKYADNYAVLKNLNTITKLSNGNSPRFYFIYNESTHEPTLLQEPDYSIQDIVDNYEYDNLHRKRNSIDGESLIIENPKQMRFYHVNMASITKIGEWLDYLRSLNVYDNTKIVIVSDHGEKIDNPLKTYINDIDLMGYNPLLLVKDFNCNEELQIDKTFMSNADVPYLCAKDTIDNPINPYTNKELSDVEKQNGAMIYRDNFWPEKDDCYYKDNGDWYLVKDNIFDVDNWTKK